MNIIKLIDVIFRKKPGTYLSYQEWADNYFSKVHENHQIYQSTCILGFFCFEDNVDFDE